MEGKLQLSNTLGKLFDGIYAVRFCSNWPQVLGTLVSGKVPTHARLKNGLDISSSQSPLAIDNEIFSHQVYNPHELPIDDNDIVVDIGANVGIFTLYAAEHTHNHVFAFEPLPLNFEYIQKNLIANNLKHVSCFCTAVSDKSGPVKFYVTAEVAGNSLADHNINGKIENYIEVPCTTLTSIMDDQKLDRIDFLKLDCEGAEGAILSAPQ